MDIKIENVAISGERKRGGRGGSTWTKAFTTMKVGQSFLLPAVTDEDLKQVRNAKAAANAWNKNDNVKKIDWRVEPDGSGVRFGPVHGPGAQPAPAASGPVEAALTDSTTAIE